jgi:RNA-binding protein Musashi
MLTGSVADKIISDGLKHYFSQFGKVNYCLIMRDPTTQRSRGFAFLTFDDPKAVNSVMVKEHFLDGKIVSRYRCSARMLVDVLTITYLAD